VNGTRGILTIGAYLVVALVLVLVAFWGLVKYGVSNPAATIQANQPLPTGELGSTRVQIASVGTGSAATTLAGQNEQRLRVLQDMVIEKSEQLRDLTDRLKAQQTDYETLSDRYEEAVAVAVDLLANTGMNAVSSDDVDIDEDLAALQAELEMAQVVQDSLSADVDRLQEELARANMELEEAQRQTEEQVADRLRDGMILEAEAANALMAIGAGAVPEVLKALDNPNPLVRRWAANILAGIGPDAQEALPALTEALSDSDAGVRAAARAAVDDIAG
jgi:HEAT repeat protein